MKSEEIETLNQNLQYLITEIRWLGFGNAVHTPDEPFGAIEGVTIELRQLNSTMSRIADSLEEIAEKTPQNPAKKGFGPY